VMTEAVAETADRVEAVRQKALDTSPVAHSDIEVLKECGTAMAQHINTLEERGVNWRNPVHDFQHEIGCSPEEMETTLPTNLRADMECSADESVTESMRLVKEHEELLAEHLEKTSHLNDKLIQLKEKYGTKKAAGHLKQIAILSTCLGPINRVEACFGTPREGTYAHCHRLIAQRRVHLGKWCEKLKPRPSRH